MSANTEVITVKDGTAIALQVLKGRVMSQGARTEWSTEQGNAVLVGKSIVPGQIYNVAHNIEDVWLLRDDGKEQKMPFASAMVDLRPGHEVVFLHGKDSAGNQRCVAAWNVTTDQIRTNKNATEVLVIANKKASWGSRLALWGPIAAAAIPMMLAKGGNQKDVAGILFWCVLGLSIAFAYFRSKSVDANALEQVKQRMSEIQARQAA